MKKRLHAFFLVLGLLMSIVTAARQAQGTLGESADSIASDRKALSAARHITTARSGYTIHEIGSGSSVVREYVSQYGIVFGVAWNGLVHPDLTQLLGSYAGEYQEALRQTLHRKGRRHLRVKTGRVVVEKWGHMRNLQGRAYAPALIPNGVNVDEIK